jgi:uncharacterized damage-inducible protein DinB
MIAADSLRSLIAYNRWANERILSAAMPELGSRPAYSDEYGVLPDTLLHILNAQETWMARWRGRAHEETEQPSTHDLLAAYARSHDELEAYGRELDDAELARRTTDGAGYDFPMPLGEQVMHLMHHGTYHRGEAALLLTQVGRSPGDIDYLDFLELP